MCEWCRIYDTRRCPISGCLGLPCARFEDDDESRWALDMAQWRAERNMPRAGLTDSEYVFEPPVDEPGRVPSTLEMLGLALSGHEFLFFAAPAPRDDAQPGTDTAAEQGLT